MMSESNSRRFRLRPFISYGTLFSFLVTAIAGIVLYLRPEGGLASWSRWSILGIDKKGWEGIHTLFVILFSLFVIGHVCLNWKPLLYHIKKKASESRLAKVEFSIALGLALLLLVAAINRWQPFGRSSTSLGYKAGNILSESAPPAVNAEELSLTALCELVGVQADEALSRLKDDGFIAEGTEITLAELAEKYGTSPENLYRIISNLRIEDADDQKQRQYP